MAKKSYHPIREMKDSLKNSIKSNKRYCTIVGEVLQSHADMYPKFNEIYGNDAEYVTELLDGLADTRKKMLEQIDVLKAGLDELSTMTGTLDDKRMFFNTLNDTNFEISYAAAEVYSNVTIALLNLTKK